MYLDYFGLARAPYRITPDTELFYGGAERGDILDAVAYAVVSGEAITKVVGEVGSGKTMLCRMLEYKLPDNIEIVYLANPSLPPENVLHAIAFELGLSISVEDNRLRVMKVLQEYLLQRHAENRQVVVFVEEAQGMPLATLEEIRLLSNLETQHNKLLQIVLFGQPELDTGLSASNVRQIKERITNSFYLPPLKFKEIRDYLAYRLQMAGFRGASVFSNTATWLITRFSGGLMRRINIIADKAMLAAFAAGSHAVRAKHVWAALRDCEFITSASWLRPVAITTSILALTIGGVVFAQLNNNSSTMEVASTQELMSSEIVTVEELKPALPSQAVIVENRNESLLQYRLQHTQSWLADVPPQHFTIQLLWAQPDEQWALERFLNEAQQINQLDQIFVYRTGGNETGPLNVVFGEFSSFSEAKAVMEQLPDSLKRYQPFLRNVRGVLAEAQHSISESTS